MVRDERDIIFNLHLALSNAGPTDAPVSGYREASVTSLVGTNRQEVRLSASIKPHPVKMLERLVQLAGDRRHDRHTITHPLGNGLDYVKNMAIGRHLRIAVNSVQISIAHLGLGIRCFGSHLQRMGSCPARTEKLVHLPERVKASFAPMANLTASPLPAKRPGPRAQTGLSSGVLLPTLERYEGKNHHFAGCRSLDPGRESAVLSLERRTGHKRSDGCR